MLRICALGPAISSHNNIRISHVVVKVHAEREQKGRLFAMQCCALNVSRKDEKSIFCVFVDDAKSQRQ